jgi:uncharacterized membrane protein (UPF0127 family)
MKLFLVFLISFISCQKNNILIFNQKILNVEIADTPEKRSIGLMYRKQLKEDHGMLFVFDKSQVVGFWMKNTFIPLSIAYIDTNFKILHISKMAPFDEETHHSSLYPVKYAVEVNQGWFKLNNVKIGDYVKGMK